MVGVCYKESELPPSSRWDLTGQVQKDGESSFALGASADFWKGKWNGRDFSVRSTISSFHLPSLGFPLRLRSKSYVQPRRGKRSDMNV